MWVEAEEQIGCDSPNKCLSRLSMRGAFAGPRKGVISPNILGHETQMQSFCRNVGTHGCIAHKSLLRNSSPNNLIKGSPKAIYPFRDSYHSHSMDHPWVQGESGYSSKPYSCSLGQAQVR